jgi:FtsP/CotA-like multicopper oxidase with cupredoxin domain
MGERDDADEVFPSEVAGLPSAGATQVVDLAAGQRFGLRIGPVRKRLGDAEVRMLAYGGSIPGPVLRVAQGTEVEVEVSNDAELEQTVHWHGLRLDNRFDGVPHDTQPPIAVGGRFGYRLRFPDPGIYWYHPHIREDYAQDMGLYGTIVVTPADPSYWPPAHRELSVTVDDVLLEDGRVAPFRRASSERTAMGRFGNVMLTNGQTMLRLSAVVGEVVRFYVVNTANTRVFRLSLPGARMKLVGGDGGRHELEEFVDDVMLSPSERTVIDVLFTTAGEVRLAHHTPEHTYVLGVVTVSDRTIEPSPAVAFDTLRVAPELQVERERLTWDLERSPDKTLALVGEMPDMGHHDMEHGDAHAPSQGPDDGIEWEDTMPDMNLLTTPATMRWTLIDRATGRANEDIGWAFRVGDRVKIRVVNDPHSDHPMQHPLHIHGQRFLVLARDGVPNANLVWKDTVLLRTGETVDLLLEVSNPGRWMVHCHIAEHIEAGMGFTFDVA